MWGYVWNQNERGEGKPGLSSAQTTLTKWYNNKAWHSFELNSSPSRLAEMNGGLVPKVGSFKEFQSGAAGAPAHHEQPWNWMEGVRQQLKPHSIMSDARRAQAQRPEPWFGGMDGRLRGGRGGEIQGDVPQAPVVNQETNGGEPKQMLTCCLVNSRLPSGTGKQTKKKKTKRDEKGWIQKNSLLDQIPFLDNSQKFLLGLKLRVTSELNGLFIDRANRTLRWQGE